MSADAGKPSTLEERFQALQSKAVAYAAVVSLSESVYIYFVLAAIYVLAFASRLFSVLRFESVIHEFDPYFNYRTTVYLVNEGIYSFHNWFDEQAWYPLGRIIGGTIYPGLMVTAAIIYKALHFIHFTVDIRNVCVLLAPFMASNTSMMAYVFTKEVWNRHAGLLAAAFIAVVPGYISRSVAGSYDNEGVAIFALLWTFYCWVKAVKSGSMFWGACTAIAFFYMVSAWGGYIFIINLIPIHAFALLVSGRFSSRLYIAYTSFYVLGTIASMQIPFVGFHPVRSSEHLAAIGMFGLLNLYPAVQYLRSFISQEQQKQILKQLVMVVLGGGAVVLLVLRAFGYVSSWTGRFYALLDPTYAKDHIPIIASVSEHQPTTWASFFFDMHVLMMLFPVGIFFCFRNLTDANIFVILYGMTSIYFAGVMVRLMLVLAPVTCVLAAIAVNGLYERYFSLWLEQTEDSTKVDKRQGKASVQSSVSARSLPKMITGFVLLMVTILLLKYQLHCSWVTSTAYSSPSIVLAANGPHGRIIFDDFRESYYWLRHNTAEDAKIMSWWDYGYQITAMANRTILVDNNTWNNTHIATVGRAMASTEDNAVPIMRELDVDYVLVIFGGMVGYASDDINKFLWMVRIGGGVFPDIVEDNYMSASGEYKIDKTASNTMLNSLMYKLSYYRFGDVRTEQTQAPGFDRVRGVEIGRKGFDLDHLEESFTSENWLVRIYRLKKDRNRP